ncbi:MAG: hypothetical protein HY059_12470 [Proteobacteria bacterium]|nr:hypothetical protein [Pseudomonadota bacterium]
MEHPLLRAAQTILGGRHSACRALERAVKSGDAFDWRAAKEQLSDLPDADWDAIKDALRSSAEIPPPGRLN